MNFFEKYNLRKTRPEFIINEYNSCCASADGDGTYRFENLEDASSFLIVGKRGSFLVERFYQNQEEYMGASTRISYQNDAGFYSVGENVFLKSKTEEDDELREPIKSYEGFVISNGSLVDLTAINAEYIFQNSKISIERTCAEQPSVASEQ